jgi:hypothetical protein
VQTDALQFRKRQKPGARLVAYNRERGEYLSHSCCASTPDRTWAWSGNVTQSRNMVWAFPYAKDFTLYWDGEEKYGEPADV